MASESITHSAFGLIVNYTEMGQLRHWKQYQVIHETFIEEVLQVFTE